jgi:hypothetical protein
LGGSAKEYVGSGIIIWLLLYAGNVAFGKMCQVLLFCTLVFSRIGWAI